MGLAILGLAASASLAQVPPEEAAVPGLLLCTEVESGEEGLYRCAPAAVVDGEILATGAPAMLTLLRQEFEALRQAVADLRARLDGGSPAAGPSAAAGTAAGAMGSGAGARSSPTNDLLWRTQPPPEPRPPIVEQPPDLPRRVSLVTASAGATDAGNVSVTLAGRYFGRIGERLAVQAEGSFDYFDGREEIGIDLGLVNRVAPGFQLALFGTVKHIGLEDFETAATLAQAAVVAERVFPRGRLGLFGVAGVSDQDTVLRETARGNTRRETFVEVVDQLGVAGRIPLSGESFLEVNAALLRASRGDEVGGLLRWVHPLGPRWAVTAEASLNPTRVSASDDETRFLVGLETGDWRGAGGFEHPARAMPVEVPGLRYEVRTRTRLLSNSFPVADAGPDQRIEPDCPTKMCVVEVVLDGSGSFDPDGAPLTFAWTPRSGFEAGEGIESAGQAVARFKAREGGRYVVRLTVDDGGLQASDEVTIVVGERPAVRIERFRSSPRRIRAGESAILEWRVANATRVTLTAGTGSPQPVTLDLGMTTVSPNKTTVYVLEAENAVSIDRRSVTITVR